MKVMLVRSAISPNTARRSRHAEGESEEHARNHADAAGHQFWP